MTTEEFKKLKPEYKDVEGDQLWNAMEDYFLQQQSGNEILKQIMPLWKTHTLRWLYYRKTPNFSLGKISTDKYKSSKRCANCKNGVNTRMVFMMMQEDGTQKYSSYCPHCSKEYVEEENTNINHKLYKIGKKISKYFWMLLDKLHLVRSSISSRYDMFGDEYRYVRGWEMNMKTGKTTFSLKKRKWWEYIFIEKPQHNF